MWDPQSNQILTQPNRFQEGFLKCQLVFSRDIRVPVYFLEEKILTSVKYLYFQFKMNASVRSWISEKGYY